MTYNRCSAFGIISFYILRAHPKASKGVLKATQYQETDPKV